MAAGPAGAHPISLTTAGVTVGSNTITVQLEVMCEDFVMLRGYTPDRDNFIPRASLEQGIDLHGPLLLSDFLLRDRDGLLLTGRVARIERPVIPERGLPADELMGTKAVYHLEYRVAKPPDYLTFQQRIGASGGAFIPSVMQLTVTQAGCPARPAVALTGEGEVHTCEFDWSGGTAVSRAAAGAPSGPDATARNMGIESYGSVYAFLYIEPAEVRIEILMPLLTLEEWVAIPRADKNFVEVAEQAAAAPAVRDFLAGRNRVLVDGIEVSPVVSRLDYYGVDFKDFAVTAEARRLSAWTARVGAILTYSTKGAPGRVEVTWDLFNERVKTARMAWFAGEEARRGRFTSYEPSLAWTNRGALSLPDVTPASGVVADDAGRARLAETLLRNIYRAFDHRDEGVVYDVLARSVRGELLADTYLKIHAGLLMSEQGGAVAHVQSVEPQETRIREARPAGFTADVKWRVTGTVEHWGHVHTRVNACEATLGITREGGVWKINTLEVARQERVGYYLQVRKFQ